MEEESVLKESGGILSECHVLHEDVPASGSDGGSPVLRTSRLVLRLDNTSPSSASRDRPPRRDEDPDKNTEASDEDDCPGLRRKKRRRQSSNSCHVTLVHALATDLDSVGQQLWRGALLLSDFLLSHPEQVRDGRLVVELGCGVGLVGVTLGLLGLGTSAVVTDRDAAILDITARNLAANVHLLAAAGLPEQPQPLVRSIDWMRDPQDCAFCRTFLHPQGVATRTTPACASLSASASASASSQGPDAYAWRKDELAIAREKGVIFLASDCVYDEDLTEALFHKVKLVLEAAEMNAGKSDRRRPSSMFMAMEKRYNFELRELSVVAHGYRRFLSFIGRDAFGRELPASDDGDDRHCQCGLRGRLIPLDFPLCFDYERVAQLELWEITAAPGAHAHNTQLQPALVGGTSGGT